MAFEIPDLVITREAGGDLSAGQYLLVELAADNQVDVVAATIGLEYFGVLQNNPDAAGQAAEIMLSGVSKMVAGAAITRGDIVVQGTTTAGRIETLAANADQNTVGRALETAGAAGEIIAVWLDHTITHA